MLPGGVGLIVRRCGHIDHPSTLYQAHEQLTTATQKQDTTAWANVIRNDLLIVRSDGRVQNRRRTYRRNQTGERRQFRTGPSKAQGLVRKRLILTIRSAPSADSEQCATLRAVIVWKKGTDDSHHFVGTRRFNSSNQCCKRMICGAAAPMLSDSPLRRMTNSPFGVMSVRLAASLTVP